MAYRWFLGFCFLTEVSHFSTFGKNYVLRFDDTDLFKQIFYRVLKEVADHVLLSADHVFIDSTQVKASANKRKSEKKTIRKETIKRVFAAQNLKKLASWTWSHPVQEGSCTYRVSYGKPS